VDRFGGISAEELADQFMNSSIKAMINLSPYVYAKDVAGVYIFLCTKATQDQGGAKAYPR
jgi:hypothetical protein